MVFSKIMRGDTKLRRSILDYFYVVLGSGFSRVFTFMSSILIARFLGPEDFGKFNIFYLSLVLTWQFSEAFDTTFICHAKATSSNEKKTIMLRAAVLMKVVYVACLIGLFSIGVWSMKVLFHPVDTFTLIFEGILAGSFLTFLMTIAHTYREREEFGKFAGLSAFYTVLILVILLLLFGYKFKIDLTDVILIYVVVTIGTGSVSLLILIRKVGNIFLLDWPMMQRSFSFGKWIFVTSIVYFVFQRTDIFFMTGYVSYEDIGVYSAAVQLIMIISLTTGALSAVFLPKAIVAINSEESLKNYMRETVAPVILVIVIIISLWILAPFCVKIAYGASYSGATVILRILLVGWAFVALFLPFSYLFLAIHEVKMRFFLQLFSLMMLVICMVLLVPTNGVKGAAISMTLALVANVSLSFWVIDKKMKQRFSLQRK